MFSRQQHSRGRDPRLMRDFARKSWPLRGELRCTSVGRAFRLRLIASATLLRLGCTSGGYAEPSGASAFALVHQRGLRRTPSADLRRRATPASRLQAAPRRTASQCGCDLLARKLSARWGERPREPGTGMRRTARLFPALHAARTRIGYGAVGQRGRDLEGASAGGSPAPMGSPKELEQTTSDRSGAA